MALPPQARLGALAELFAALEAILAASTLHAIFEDAFASSTAPRRLKLLTLAVVARGVGAERIDASTRWTLVAEGCDASMIERVLRSLADLALEGLEAIAIPLSRETLRYRIPRCQRRMRTESERVPAPMSEALDERFNLRDMPPVAVKGKADPIPTCAALGMR